jgi:pimeloyl-ACP methyl ester carboxylesterase
MGHSITERQVSANGLRFTCLEVGQGPLVLCLHGFPDTPHGYTDVLLRLAADGYRAVAPYARGIFPTSEPAGDDYSAEALGSDALALISALGAERATVIGHDWGAVTAYAAVGLGPERVEKLVTLAIPPLRVVKPTPAWLAMVTFFQTGPLARAALRAGGGALADRIYRAASPNWSFSPEDTAPFKRVVANPAGVRGALGTYRSFFQQVLRRGLQMPDFLDKRIAVPSMVVVGTTDPTLPAATVRRIPGEFEGPFELVTLEGTGHFPHREQPEAFYQHLARFLAR